MYRIIINGTELLKDADYVNGVFRDSSKTLMSAITGNPVTSINQMNEDDTYMLSKLAAGNK